MSYYRECPKCGTTGYPQVTYNPQQDVLVITCPVCGYTKHEETYEKRNRNAVVKEVAKHG